VFARGELTVGTKRGELQLVVRQLLATTEGGFYAIALERARAALEKDGLPGPGAQAAAAAVPACHRRGDQPGGGGVARHSSPWSDAAGRRPSWCWSVPAFRVTARWRNLCRALALANRLTALELLMRGARGGSKEDLWAFNDERVARAVAAFAGANHRCGGPRDGRDP